MIAYLKGTVMKGQEKSIILDTGAIGYLVNVSRTLAADVEENEELELFTHTHVREDALDIYGFKTHKELAFFKQLIAISGVGPKTAQDIVALPLNELKSSILSDDITLISSVPKVGKKIAHRIIIELKNKIDPDDLEILDRSHTQITTGLNEDVLSALEKLGYSRKQIQKGLTKLPKEITDPEQIIKHFLQYA
ncbi:Holliday junction branch migration protein RuvA [Candidatus Peregrinibacteria bacterium]|jgi:holliday junction DNA helicase RuvA|nr:Holliday junction branch migration protein RuvA [Candidatus Peregrinibacteria bacterium]MBT4056234.1 Holliday junction branch migration protein RuvA [Candidatus Peregrinibacteria bacterium]